VVFLKNHRQNHRVQKAILETGLQEKILQLEVEWSKPQHKFPEISNGWIAINIFFRLFSVW